MKQLINAFKSTAKSFALTTTAAAIEAGKVVATAGVAATGVGLHHTSVGAGKAAVAMARGSERLAGWLYKHVPVVVAPEPPSQNAKCSCGQDAEISQDGVLYCGSCYKPNASKDNLPKEVVANIAVNNAGISASILDIL